MLGTLLYVLHLLGAVLWVGGMAFALLALRPALARLEPAQRLAVHEEALRRFLRLVWHAMPAMLLTGYALLFGWYGGFAGAGWHIHAMHMLALAMAGIVLALATGPWKAFRAARARADLAAAATEMDRVRQLILLNCGLGLLTVAIAAAGRFGG
ncbi:CopD family protein [Roseicella frigidaeris]|uniref:Copper resistance protein D domain-containing protein n=1 Tax=Roseicella frigidaeris TaxID=2230885 RepID=A0A327MJ22_9PROT|nr:CopD family protein [Roseicella frigidaeris]RAI60168.1 hypothetical protein DOO78_03510 [Roseicella frigidaeris]